MSQPEQEAETLQLAQEVHRWGLTAPALFGLEVGKPLTFLGAQLIYFGSPVLHLFDSLTGSRLAGWAGRFAELLENPAAVARLSEALSNEEERA